MSARFLLAVLVVANVATALLVVRDRHEHRQAFMALSKLERARDELNIEFGRLQLEQATLAEAKLAHDDVTGAAAALQRADTLLAKVKDPGPSYGQYLQRVRTALCARADAPAGALSFDKATGINCNSVGSCVRTLTNLLKNRCATSNSPPSKRAIRSSAQPLTVSKPNLPRSPGSTLSTMTFLNRPLPGMVWMSTFTPIRARFCWTICAIWTRS